MDESTGPLTLSIDIGGSGVKMMILDAVGEPVTERLRRKTPDQPTPSHMLKEIVSMAAEIGAFDRVSVGFPGVVVDGRTQTAVNLHNDWAGFDLRTVLAERLGKDVRVANDADVQGLGVVEGIGVELVLTLGTGIGSALFTNGRLVPNLELGHHPFERGKTYEERMSDEELRKKGKDAWNERLQRAIATVDRVFNYRVLYLGGGNARKINSELPPNVRIVPNVAGILGGIRLWD
jgi:polyphosphate glucokinase